MKTIFISQLILFSFASVQSQGLQGEYFIAAALGDISLSLSSTDNLNFTGEMIAADGSAFSIVAKKNSNLEIVGTIADHQNQMGFGATLVNHQLKVSLIPLDIDGIPISNQTQSFIMNPKNENNSKSNSYGGPLAMAGSLNRWNGTYYGDIKGTSATLILTQDGSSVTGKIDASGYFYNISGTSTDSQFLGELIDPQTQGKMSCSGTMQKDQVSLVIKDPTSGQSFTLNFSKTNPGISSQSNNQAAGVERDSNLIGNWLYSDSYTNGDFSFTTQYRLIVNPDGTYLYGDAKMAGGGPGVSGISEGGGYTKGQWKTQNKIIHINEGYGWQPYAKYYVEGNSMMMTFSDGSKQVWKRY